MSGRAYAGAGAQPTVRQTQTGVAVPTPAAGKRAGWTVNTPRGPVAAPAWAETVAVSVVASTTWTFVNATPAPSAATTMPGSKPSPWNVTFTGEPPAATVNGAATVSDGTNVRRV